MSQTRGSGKTAGRRGRPHGEISELTTRRLAVYLRCLGMLEAAGVDTVSSKELAEQFHLNSAQFRKDLAYFGEFGVRGKGYDVKQLKEQLVEILGLDREVRLAIFGAGNLGRALAGYDGFNRGNFRVVGVFDADPDKIGATLRDGLEIEDIADLDQVLQARGMDIAVLAVPPAAGQEVLDRIAASGIQAVLSFVPRQMRVPDGVNLKTVDLKVQVEALVYQLHAGRNGGSASGAGE